MWKALWSNFGLQILSKISLFGASTLTYSCVGSGSRFSITLGRLPLVTRKVEVPCWWQTSRNSPSREYSVGSPFREMATCLGFWASSHFSRSALGLPP